MSDQLTRVSTKVLFTARAILVDTLLLVLVLVLMAFLPRLVSNSIL